LRSFASLRISAEGSRSQTTLARPFLIVGSVRSLAAANAASGFRQKAPARKKHSLTPENRLTFTIFGKSVKGLTDE